MHGSSTIHGQNVKLAENQQNLHGELSDRIHYECCFCTKTVAVYPVVRRACERLSGPENFYCGFCLRHGYNTRNNRNILPMSFRAIAGYYYYEKYAYSQRGRDMFLGDIKDLLDSHAEAGMLNPVFNYDWESMMWFVDFSRIGRGRRKLKMTDVLKTIVSILTCFNLRQNISGIDAHKMYQKYAEAVKAFYEQRYRPEGKPLLIPTLAGCGVYDTNKRFSLDATRFFTASDLVDTTTYNYYGV